MLQLYPKVVSIWTQRNARREILRSSIIVLDAAWTCSRRQASNLRSGRLCCTCHQIKRPTTLVANVIASLADARRQVVADKISSPAIALRSRNSGHQHMHQSR